jgi:hypothetical protein
MRRPKLASALLGLVIFCSVSATPKSDREACEEVKQQIREIESRMRNGYSAAQGIRYAERLRKLKEKRYKLCR